MPIDGGGLARKNLPSFDAAIGGALKGERYMFY